MSLNNNEKFNGSFIVIEKLMEKKLFKRNSYLSYFDKKGICLC